MTTQGNQRLRLLGVELYVDDLPRSRDFYGGVLGLPLEEEQPDRHAKFAPLSAFLCLERKGVENYPSKDKAVVFLEVADLQSYLASVGAERFVRVELGATPPWAVLHDPDGHNVVLIEGAKDRPA